MSRPLSSRDKILASLKRQRGNLTPLHSPSSYGEGHVRRDRSTASQQPVPVPDLEDALTATRAVQVTFQEVFDVFASCPRLYELQDSVNIKTIHDMMQNIRPPLSEEPRHARAPVCVHCNGELLVFPDCSSCTRCGVAQVGPRICDENPFREFGDDKAARSQWTHLDGDRWRSAHSVPVSLKNVSHISRRSENEERANRRDEAFALVDTAMATPPVALAKARCLYNAYAEIHRVSKSINLAVACVLTVLSERRVSPQTSDARGVVINTWACPNCGTTVDGIMRRRHHVRRCRPM
tara:strand:- start:35 stop:916 length:882 start_codon:yes stop_codon:yes gene_type:complete